MYLLTVEMSIQGRLVQLYGETEIRDHSIVDRYKIICGV